MVYYNVIEKKVMGGKIDIFLLTLLVTLGFPRLKGRDKWNRQKFRHEFKREFEQLQKRDPLFAQRILKYLIYSQIGKPLPDEIFQRMQWEYWLSEMSTKIYHSSNIIDNRFRGHLNKEAKKSAQRKILKFYRPLFLQLLNERLLQYGGPLLLKAVLNLILSKLAKNYTIISKFSNFGNNREVYVIIMILSSLISLLIHIRSPHLVMSLIKLILFLIMILGTGQYELYKYLLSEGWSSEQIEAALVQASQMINPQSDNIIDSQVYLEYTSSDPDLIWERKNLFSISNPRGFETNQIVKMAIPLLGIKLLKACCMKNESGKFNILNSLL